jgi:hypothetical protein
VKEALKEIYEEIYEDLEFEQAASRWELILLLIIDNHIVINKNKQAH